MKITWFGGTTLRIHTGGSIVVVDAEGAPDWVDRTELTGAADIVTRLEDTDLPAFDPAGWRPRPKVRPLDETGKPPERPILRRAAPAAIAIEAEEEALLVLAGGAAPWGRWADGAVIVLCGPDAAETGLAALDWARPRLVLLADGGESFAALRAHPGVTGMQVLEPGLPVEA